VAAFRAKQHSERWQRYIQGGKAQWQRFERSSFQSGAAGSEILPQGGKGFGWSTDDEHERVVVLT